VTTNFYNCFVREPDGAWRCIEATELHFPEGRVQVTPGTVLGRGSRFMNVDLKQILEGHYEREQGRAGSTPG